MGDEQPQRTAVDRNQFDVANHQTAAAAERLDRTQRVVAKVLVIDGVELELSNEVAHIGSFDHRHAIRLEQLFDAADECVGIGNVGEDIVRVDDVGELPLCCESSSEILVEELDQRWNSFCLDGELCDVGGWFDAENRDPPRLIELQQVSVVAGNLDDQAPVV